MDGVAARGELAGEDALIETYLFFFSFFLLFGEGLFFHGLVHDTQCVENEDMRGVWIIKVTLMTDGRNVSVRQCRHSCFSLRWMSFNVMTLLVRQTPPWQMASPRPPDTLGGKISLLPPFFPFFRFAFSPR